MRSPPTQDSIEVFALRELRRAAMVYTARFLLASPDIAVAEEELTDAARNYAAVVDEPKPRKQGRKGRRVPR